jgi:leucyl-tRNA synthetase
MQHNWIGRSEGARLTFPVEGGEPLEVFTTRPDTVWGATFMVLAPEHPLVEKITTAQQVDSVARYVEQAGRQSEIERLSTDESRPKTGVFTGGFARNPVTDERIPIWIADYVLMGYGTGAIMAVPAHDERDFAFARTFDLPIRVVIQPDGDQFDSTTMPVAFVGPGRMVNSGSFDGLAVPQEIGKVIEWLERSARGKAEVNYRLRDWLISRQRYWGTPIPVIYCDKCGMVPVPEQDLPVTLPLDAEFAPTGQSPLLKHPDFLHVECPRCGAEGRRETDTMDTFVDSSWYWLRYTSPHEEMAPFDKNKAANWCPVDLYCGGIEHAILHLLYARFFTRVLRDIGLVEHSEPFLRLRNQGMILAEEGTKMSKSRGTQVDPDDLVRKYGADSLRLHLMYLGPWDQGGPWNSRGITGMERFIKRVFALIMDVAGTAPEGPADSQVARALERLAHKTIKRVTLDLNDFQFNTMVAALIEFTNTLYEIRTPELSRSSEWLEALRTLVLLMAPVTPHVAEEMWCQLGLPYSVHLQSWPEFDDALARDDEIEIVIQLNGKVRDRIVISANLPEPEVRDLALSLPKVAERLATDEPKRVIYVPGRLINIVT